MKVKISFYSYFKDLTGCPQTTEDLVPGATLGDLFGQLVTRYPRLREMQKSVLMAVGVEYQTRNYQLQDGDEVSLFPPVQGG